MHVWNVLTTVVFLKDHLKCQFNAGIFSTIVQYSMMENITGKILVTTDWHLGLKNNSKSRLAIVVKVVKELIAHIKQHNVKTLIFAGDLFHCRTSIDVNVINVAYKLLLALSKHCKLYMICGNHDSYLKNTIDINSLNMFKSMDNVVIVDQPLQVSINGNNTLFVPWLGDLSKFENGSFDMMFGHFDVSHDYIIKSYVEEHSACTLSEQVANAISADFSSCASTTGDLAGNFVDKAKKNGTIFSGHLHGRKEFMSKGRKFVLIGDPYQQNMGEKDYSCGYYMIDENNNYAFFPVDDVPKHIDLKMSLIVKDIDNYDFSAVKGNIVHKTYDIEVSVADDAKIAQRINDWQPYEELLPDYDVKMPLNSILSSQNKTFDMLKKSKMEYVKNYIKNIDDKVINEYGIDREKLFNLINDHYCKVAEEK